MHFCWDHVDREAKTATGAEGSRREPTGAEEDHAFPNDINIAEYPSISGGSNGSEDEGVTPLVLNAHFINSFRCYMTFFIIKKFYNISDKLRFDKLSWISTLNFFRRPFFSRWTFSSIHLEPGVILSIVFDSVIIRAGVILLTKVFERWLPV